MFGLPGSKTLASIFPSLSSINTRAPARVAKHGRKRKHIRRRQPWHTLGNDGRHEARGRHADVGHPENGGGHHRGAGSRCPTRSKKGPQEFFGASRYRPM